MPIASHFPYPYFLEKMRSFCKIQLSVEELKLIADVVKHKERKNSKVRFLIFGTGHDSKFWYLLNKKGETLFVEDNLEWVEIAKSIYPYLNILPVSYGTFRAEWQKLLLNPNCLREQLPDFLLNKDWDVILVDAPDGSSDSAPGRMKSIFWSSILASQNTDVFVHDCNREVEKNYCDRFLGIDNINATVQRLRWYKINHN
ncbi:hypothetical protein PN457_15850 [Anabaenopsis arnoldii]|uniref:Polysaccharide biosynthesis domain-containing protein n=1 Tax=Anabaenopsis arnoldii TaxID=2152938 RepID=A0ABT5AUW9_9CYAN|nr:hypothetical protein [Anabaenopsis arnoldii]